VCLHGGKCTGKRETTADSFHCLLVHNESHATAQEEALFDSGYYNGMNLEECVAPKPGLPCNVGLYVMENSPK
jgi:hypothetical protein